MPLLFHIADGNHKKENPTTIHLFPARGQEYPQVLLGILVDLQEKAFRRRMKRKDDRSKRNNQLLQTMTRAEWGVFGQHRASRFA